MVMMWWWRWMGDEDEMIVEACVAAIVKEVVRQRFSVEGIDGKKTRAAASWCGVRAKEMKERNRAREAAGGGKG